MEPIAEENFLLTQQPKPAAEPAVPAPAKNAPTADAKKPPLVDDEPEDDTAQPEPPRRFLTPDLGLLAFHTPSQRLASVPNMLGDLNQCGQIMAIGNNTVAADLPIAGGGYRLKVAENNKALPMNRSYFMYNHFHNALDVNVLTTGAARSLSVDRFTMGIERTFLNDLWSVDVRMPLVGSHQFSSGGLTMANSSAGNLQVTLKRLLAQGEYGAVAAGLAIDTPTGSDVAGQFDSTSFTMHNQAVHLAPYIGFLHVPDDRFFWQGFLQLDIPTNGNRIDFADTTFPPSSGSFGTFTEQTLLYADVSAGYWLYRNHHAHVLTGFASVVEFHYTTTLSDADVIPAATAGPTFQFGSLLGNVDVTNVTVGLHTELFGETTLRVAGVFPLQDGAERPFDSEVVVSLNFYR